MSDPYMCACGAAQLVPGSKVLIGVDFAVTLEAVQNMKERLAERFPDVEFAFIQGRVEAVMGA